jgi:hypothetical protein
VTTAEATEVDTTAAAVEGQMVAVKVDDGGINRR